MLHPNVENVFEFWGENNKYKGLNLNVGDEIVFSTKGDSIFLDGCHHNGGGNLSCNESFVIFVLFFLFCFVFLFFFSCFVSVLLFFGTNFYELFFLSSLQPTKSFGRFWCKN